MIFFSSVTFSQQNFTVTKGAFFSDPLSFSPHDISKIRVCNATVFRIGWGFVRAVVTEMGKKPRRGGLGPLGKK